MNLITKKLALLGVVMMFLLSQLATAAPILLSGHDAENCSCCQKEPAKPKSCCDDAAEQEIRAEHDCKCYVSAPTQSKQSPAAALTSAPHFEVSADFAPELASIPISYETDPVQIPFSKAHPPNGPPTSDTINRGPPASPSSGW